MNIVEQMHINSPWLVKSEWHNDDRQISLVKQSGIEFRHLNKDFSFNPGTISIIRGPRQIGKTTECKLIVREGIIKDKKPEQFIYFPCDNLINRKERKVEHASFC